MAAAGVCWGWVLVLTADDEEGVHDVGHGVARGGECLGPRLGLAPPLRVGTYPLDCPASTLQIHGNSTMTDFLVHPRCGNPAAEIYLLGSPEKSVG